MMAAKRTSAVSWAPCMASFAIVEMSWQMALRSWPSEMRPGSEPPSLTKSMTCAVGTKV